MDVAAYVKDLKLYEGFEGLDDTAMRGLGSVFKGYSTADVKRFFDNLKSIPPDTDGLEFFLKDGMNGVNKFAGTSFQAEVMATGRIAEFDINNIDTLNHRIVLPNNRNVAGVDAVTSGKKKYWEFKNRQNLNSCFEIAQIKRHLGSIVSDNSSVIGPFFSDYSYHLVIKCPPGMTPKHAEDLLMEWYNENILPDLDVNMKYIKFVPRAIP